MVDVADKLAYFQAITGLEDPDLCTEIFQAHGSDLELAISSFTSVNQPSASTTTTTSDSEPRDSLNRTESASGSGLIIAPAPGLAWKLMTLPIFVISDSLGLISGAVGFGLWAAGEVLSYSLGMIELGSVQGEESSSGLISVSAAASEAMDFMAAFEREYGTRRPNFVGEGFMDALQRSWNAFKLLFVYLHSPDHPDSPVFCERTFRGAGGLCE